MRFVVVAGLALVVLSVVYKNSRFGVETPSYELLRQDGPFEIREYPSMVLVATPLESEDITEGTSFMRLFRYISGSNETERKISMTTPVMTSRENTSPRMSFIVPEGVADDGAPQPLADDVALEKFDGGRFAVYRYSGRWERAQFEEAASKLREWVREQNLEASSAPIAANYDPPYTPLFLRRNEVLIRVDS
jgi:DNA gyrase inhibitor GyrI